MTSNPGPRIFGHRGGNLGPENSIETVRLAIAAGLDGVEIDVQLTEDGELVTRHDILQAGEAGGKIDRLADMLAVARADGIELLLDVKTTGDAAPIGDLVAALADALDSELDGGVVVSSFDTAFLESMGRAAPWVDLVPIVSLRQNFFPPIDPTKWSGVSVLAMALVANPWFWRQIRRSDARLYVWFGATEWRPVIRLLTRYGADALILGDVRRP